MKSSHEHFDIHTNITTNDVLCQRMTEGLQLVRNVEQEPKGTQQLHEVGTFDAEKVSSLLMLNPRN